MSNLNSSTDVWVTSIEHLKDRPKANEALKILQRTASLVKPIMRKHSWRLPNLGEFFPNNPNLLGLNINGGQKILIRLRPAHAPDSFYPEEDIIGTMLHELTHNVHGPHDEKFYKFLSSLEEEYYELKRSGYSGEGFFSKGHRLGLGVSHDLPPHLARQKALQAAEKRRGFAQVLGGGGKLGGGGLARAGMSPREVAALAAERRAKDAKSCGSGPQAEREAEQAAKDSVKHDVIDLTFDSDSDSDVEFVEDDDDVIIVDDDNAVAGPSKVAIPQSKQHAAATSFKPSSLPSGKRRDPASRSRSATSTSSTSARSTPYPPSSSRTTPTAALTTSTSNTPTSIDGATAWSCSVCTLINPVHALQCDACASPRPIRRGSTQSGWTCRVCGEQGMNHDFWTCTFCGTVKDSSAYRP